MPDLFDSYTLKGVTHRSVCAARPAALEATS